MDWKPCSLHREIQPYVKSIGILTSSDTPVPVRNLPTGNIQILAQLSDGYATCDEGVAHQITGPQISVIGQRSRFSIYTPDAGTRVLCVEFYAFGAAAFFRESLAHLNGLSVSVADLWSRTNLLAEIREAQSDADIFRLVQNELRRRLHRDEKLTHKIRLLQQAIATLSSGKTIGIEKLAQETGLHRRAMERLFHDYVGLSPGAFARIQRVTGAAHLVSGANGFNALDFALDRGYYDQAHFNHDFKAIIGLSPTEYRNSLIRV